MRNVDVDITKVWRNADSWTLQLGQIALAQENGKNTECELRAITPSERLDWMMSSELRRDLVDQVMRGNHHVALEHALAEAMGEEIKELRAEIRIYLCPQITY